MKSVCKDKSYDNKSIYKENLSRILMKWELFEKSVQSNVKLVVSFEQNHVDKVKPNFNHIGQILSYFLLLLWKMF